MSTRRTLRASERAAIALLAAVGMAIASSCGAAEQTNADTPVAPSVWEAKGPMTELVLPDGYEMRCEMRSRPDEQAEGMMFRPELPPDVCMLFIFETLEQRAFWMFQTLHPLDIVWLDDNKQIVEMSANTPPCTSRDFRQCPSYGGTAAAVYVVEMRAGSIARHGLETGQTINF